MKALFAAGLLLVFPSFAGAAPLLTGGTPGLVLSVAYVAPATPLCDKQVGAQALDRTPLAPPQTFSGSAGSNYRLARLAPCRVSVRLPPIAPRK